MDFKVITNEKEYDIVVSELDSILDSGKEDDETMKRLNSLSRLIEQYDDLHYTISE